MSQVNDLSRDTAEYFGSAISMSFEDAMQRRLRYHLLRLTGVGLLLDEVDDLGELGRLAFESSDVTGQVAKIRERAGVTSLAIAIANIVEDAGKGVRGQVSLRAVFLGAVLGAYAAVGGVRDMDQTTVAILGAIGGAIALPTSIFIDQINKDNTAEYLNMQEN